MDTSALIPRLEEAAPKSVLEMRPFGRSGEVSIWVEMSAIAKIARVLRFEREFSMDWLENLTAIQVDDALVLNYFLRSNHHGNRLIIRGSLVPRGLDAVVEAPSVADSWEMARPFEIEIEDLFGVLFHSGDAVQRRVLPQDWRGFPLRKEYVFPTEFLGIPHSRPMRPEGGAE